MSNKFSNYKQPIIIHQVSNGYYIKPLSSVTANDDGDFEVEMNVFSSTEQLFSWLKEYFNDESQQTAPESSEPEVHQNPSLSDEELAMIVEAGFDVCPNCGKVSKTVKDNTCDYCKDDNKGEDSTSV